MIVEKKKKTGNCQLSFLIFLPSLHELIILERKKMSAILFNFPELMIVERKKKTGNCQLSFLIFLPSLHELMILGKNVSYLFFYFPYFGSWIDDFGERKNCQLSFLIFLTLHHELMIFSRVTVCSFCCSRVSWTTQNFCGKLQIWRGLRQKDGTSVLGCAA